jgi:hypothetical protein
VARPFPSPWSVDEQAACFIVRDRGGQALAYVYFEEEPMDMLTILGLFAVTAMLVFYALEDQSPWYIVAFAGACALGSVYGFLQGAWPFGLVEAIWAGVALWRWRAKVKNA